MHLVEASGGGRAVRVRAVTSRSRTLGIGGGIVSTAAPAAAAVRLLARGRIEARGALPPERCIDPDEMFAELEQRGSRFEVEVTEEAARMKVGVPTEIKADEYRVALTPAGARELAEHGHDVILIQAGAGEGSAISDAEVRGPGRADRPRRRRRSSARPSWC